MFKTWNIKLVWPKCSFGYRFTMRKRFWREQGTNSHRLYPTLGVNKPILSMNNPIVEKVISDQLQNMASGKKDCPTIGISVSFVLCWRRVTRHYEPTTKESVLLLYNKSPEIRLKTFLLDLINAALELVSPLWTLYAKFRKGNQEHPLALCWICIRH